MAIEQYIDTSLHSGDFSCEHIQVHKVSGRETISQLFHYAIDIVDLGATDTFDLDKAQGADASLCFKWHNPDEVGDPVLRWVHGMIHKVESWLDPEVEFESYRVHLVPRAWRLTMVETQEIFLNMTVPDIIRQKLEQVGLVEGDDFELRLEASYPECEFITQYKESDLAFVSRLAEHRGIAFHFEHGGQGGRERMIFGDHQAAFQQIGSHELRPRGDEREVYRLRRTDQLIPGTYAVHDYNYRTPQVDINAERPLRTGYAGGVIEYGTHYKTPGEGARYAQLRAEERECTRIVYEGTSDLPQLYSGARFELGSPPSRMESPQLLVTEVRHEATQPVVTHGGGDQDRHYQNTFLAQPAPATYRPPRLTPRPRIYGLVTGIVEHGPEKGTERWAKLDDQGRYTIRFLYDTADHTPKNSRWCRMLQPHAGTFYGHHWPLKPGIEVAIAFIDGDPDRPMIVGSVPNPVTPSPVTEANHRINKMKTESGCIIEFHDA